MVGALDLPTGRLLDVCLGYLPGFLAGRAFAYWLDATCLPDTCTSEAKGGRVGTGPSNGCNGYSYSTCTRAQLRCLRFRGAFRSSHFFHLLVRNSSRPHSRFGHRQDRAKNLKFEGKGVRTLL